MLETREFLGAIKASPEFRAILTRSAAGLGYDLSNADESLAEDLSNRITVLFGEILFELTDERFFNRTHGSRKTYDDHCRGPLCRKSERDRSRRRYQNGNPDAHQNRRRSALDDVVIDYVLETLDKRTETREGAA